MTVLRYLDQLFDEIFRSGMPTPKEFDFYLHQAVRTDACYRIRNLKGGVFVE